ncbi:MAG TPA: hypothetical protein VMN36_18040 [Verrucomicrobiales bacterium]|nr:hypothetical protein [Verrucomicrobiales bacterium]
MRKFDAAIDEGGAAEASCFGFCFDGKDSQVNNPDVFLFGLEETGFAQVEVDGAAFVEGLDLLFQEVEPDGDGPLGPV